MGRSLSQALPYALLAVGTVGFFARSATFVLVTLPHHYGSNPGFGAYEVLVAPWWATLCIGVGLATSLRTGLVVFLVGFVALGFVAQLLSRLFGRRG